MALSRSEFPPQGWMFFQPQTGWSAPTPKASTFDQTVILIQKHRLANPAVTVKHNLATDTESIAKELEAYTRTRLGLPDASMSPAQAAAMVPGAQPLGKCCGQI